MRGNFLPVDGFAMFYLPVVLQRFTKYEAYRQAKVSPQTPLDQRGLVEQR